MTLGATPILATIRLAAVYLLVGLMLVFARPTPLGVAGGATLVVCGELLRIWAAGHLLKNDSLATSGPYRYTRNPLYLGRLIIFAGLCVLARLPYGTHWMILIVGTLVFFGYYLPRKERVEPARLLEIHGEPFERYHRAVPALLPLRGAWGAAARDPWSLRRALGNREHWMVVALAAVMLFLVFRA